VARAFIHRSVFGANKANNTGDNKGFAMSKKPFRIGLAFVRLAAVVLAMTCVGSVHGTSSRFWAINQFTTIQQIDGDSGLVVQAFPVPFILPASVPHRSR